jgi:hypothetical protein
VSTKSSSFISIPLWELSLSPKFAGTSDVVYDAAPDEVGGQKSWLLLVVIIFKIVSAYISHVHKKDDIQEENMSIVRIQSIWRKFLASKLMKKSRKQEPTTFGSPNSVSSAMSTPKKSNKTLFLTPPKGILRVKNENQLPKQGTPKMKSQTEAKVEAKAWYDTRVAAKERKRVTEESNPKSRFF